MSNLPLYLTVALKAWAYFLYPVISMWLAGKVFFDWKEIAEDWAKLERDWLSFPKQDYATTKGVARAREGLRTARLCQWSSPAVILALPVLLLAWLYWLGV